MNLDSQVSQLNRVGKTVAKQLKYLCIETVQDLLFYYPFRHEDYSQIARIDELQAGNQVTVQGRIEVIANRRNFRTKRFITDAFVSDDTGRLRVIWFGQPYIAKNLRAGDMVYLSGKIGKDKLGINMVSPSYEKSRETPLSLPPNRGEVWVASKFDSIHTARIVPIYSLTSGITQKQLRFLVSQIIFLAKNIKDWLPTDIREAADVMPLGEAVRLIHFPESEDDLKHARRRLKFDELFILQLRAEMIKQSLKRQTAPEIKFQEKAIREFVSRLPFQLTDSQKIVTWEILRDMQAVEPMNRLLQGEVGSGKTVVAAIIAQNSVLNNYQVILMAPTEVLANQHYDSFVKLFDNTKIALYTRSRAELNLRSDIGYCDTLPAKKKFLAKKIKKGEINIVIGTHALLSENVEFKDLGLVVVDEQQRFGVEQRKTIRAKSGLSCEASAKTGNESTTPHFLSMTATPIPRSFALTVYGDLAMSIIKGLPPGRKAIKTRLVSGRNRDKAYEFIKNQVKEGIQVFVICPIISQKSGEVEKTDYIGNWKLETVDEKRSVLSEYEKLSKNIFPDLRIGYLHGKMKPKEKEETMKKMSDGDMDILVSTSVIEVGVNIPNASVMMIEGADRFGLAQLHQFRGRVGRSSRQSYCFLFTDSDSQKALDRLSFFENNNDGFKLAEFDLAQRGPGEVYGFAQSGLMNFRFASMRDTDIIKLARELAKGIDFERYPTLKDKVKEWENSVHLE